jgi:hypothetical protein
MEKTMENKQVAILEKCVHVRLHFWSDLVKIKNFRDELIESMTVSKTVTAEQFKDLISAWLKHFGEKLIHTQPGGEKYVKRAADYFSYLITAAGAIEFETIDSDTGTNYEFSVNSGVCTLKLSIDASEC